MIYTHDIIYDGVTLANDVDFDIDVEVNADGEIEVTRVCLDGRELMTNLHSILSTVGCDIAFAAENDEDVQHKALVAAGRAYVGGHNNPDGRWVNA
jgi:hypothetical protein